MPITYTPLRYPGGKSSLYPDVLNLIETNSLKITTYVEPFAGGAGLAMKLLLLDEVESIALNDLDPAIACFWKAVTERPSDLAGFVEEIGVDLDEWTKQRVVYKDLRAKALAGYESNESLNGSVEPMSFLAEEERFDLACAAFYMNRTNRSGIMAGGPIGGKRQESVYKINARFNKADLIRKITEIAGRADSIRVHNYDARDYIKAVVPSLSGRGGSDVLVYFDPPYVDKGPGLYQNSLSEKDHCDLAALIGNCKANWMVTYDECALTRQLYKGFSPSEISVGYCAYKIKQGKELLVLSDGLKLERQSA